VAVDGVVADEELLADLRLRQRGREHLQYVQLASAQLVHRHGRRGGAVGLLAAEPARGVLPPLGEDAQLG
jgi:hypothetical protein